MGRLFWWAAVAGLALLLGTRGAAVAGDDTTRALAAAAQPLLATGDDPAGAVGRTTMAMTASPPWGAVGFVDNGCTGTLIDSQHVLAASHCFTFDYDGQTAAGRRYLQGAWQTGLVFFPNYHPSRPNPPRYAIDRVIVGSRVQDDPNQPRVSADWGIGHLATAVQGFPALAILPLARWQYPTFVRFAGYARDPGVFRAGAWSYPQPAPGGYCANFRGNCWWIPALVDPWCLALEDVDGSGIVALDNYSCLIQGGNSGSPVIVDRGEPGSPAVGIAGVISGGGGFWSAGRFEHAPRFAAEVAVASVDDGAERTQVFAIDRDLGKVVSRQRREADVTGPFAWFRHLGAVPRPAAIAALRIAGGRPQVVVMSGTERLYTSHAEPGGQWSQWRVLPGPAGVARFIDLAGGAGAVGSPRLFVAAGDNVVYTTAASSVHPEATWLPWSSVLSGVKARRLAGVRHPDGRYQLLAVSNAGALVTTWQTIEGPASPWSSPTGFGGSGMPAIVDVAAAWAANGEVRLFALDGAGNTWTRTANGATPNGAWGPWTPWPVPLYAPRAAAPPRLDGLVSLSAGRWLEGGDSIRPVVFATDNQGNIYVTAEVAGAWEPWRSFYN